MRVPDSLPIYINKWRKRESIFFFYNRMLINICGKNNGVRKSHRYCQSSRLNFDKEQDIYIVPKYVPTNY